MIALSLACLPLALQEPSGNVPTFPQDKVVTAGVLEEEIDRSLHWLRGRFDPARGTYGSPELDAWALLAFADSPRKYRPGDGPFVDRPLASLLAAQAADGTFRSGDKVITGIAAHVLAKLGAPGEVLERAARAQGALATFVSAPIGTADEARRLAREALAGRRSDASWGQGDGAVRATAEKIDLLSRCHRTLKESEGKQVQAEARSLPAFTAAQRAEVERALQRGAAYLLEQRVEGGWGFDGHRDAGITAMAVGALLALPAPRPAPVQAAVDQGLDFLVSLQQEDGSIHEGQLANYVTSAAILALANGGREADRPRIQRASAFLKALQADEGEGYSSLDRYYGGVGYGGDERPDLSNLQMALEALHTAGVPPSDPAFQKALAFLQRCQNRSESNDLAVVSEGKTVAAGNDGGAAYAPGESKAGFIDLPDGHRVPRSYGSMSYALLKGYLFAGLSRDDARVQAVWQWLRANYTLDVNPGFEASDDPTASYQGLFYYFYTMAKALDLFGEESLVDSAGRAHDWRGELCGRLVAMQRPDGSWVNENAQRWFEGNPVLATSYALLTLGTALPPAK